VDSVELVGAGLFHDPMFVFIQPDDARRRRSLRWYVPNCLRMLRSRGRVDEIPERAVALWIPPDSKVRPPLMTPGQLMAAPFRLGPAAMQRAMEFAAALDESWRDSARGAWRLLHVAVDPGTRRQGHAAAVLAPTLGEADATGTRCYVAAMSEAVLPFFATEGFEVEHHLRIEGLPQFWTMVRDPRP
jgi:GNAT superfamily N-acetyltransferase